MHTLKLVKNVVNNGPMIYPLHCSLFWKTHEFQLQSNLLSY